MSDEHTTLSESETAALAESLTAWLTTRAEREQAFVLEMLRRAVGSDAFGYGRPLVNFTPLSMPTQGRPDIIQVQQLLFGYNQSARLMSDVEQHAAAARSGITHHTG